MSYTESENLSSNMAESQTPEFSENEGYSLFIVDTVPHSEDFMSTVKQKLATDTNNDDVEMLACSVTAMTTGTKSVMEHIIQMYRCHSLQKNERETVLSMDDQLLAIQLTLANMSKQTSGDFNTDASKVLLAQKELNSFTLEGSLSCTQQSTLTKEEFMNFTEEYDKFLVHNNMTDLLRVYKKVKTEAEINKELEKELMQRSLLVFGVPSNDVEMQYLQLLGSCRSITRITAELSLDHSFTDSVNTDNINLSLESVSSLNEVIQPTLAGSAYQSVTEAHVEKVMMDYVHLLVNSRSELALARAINMPDREIKHRAFTALKHKAQEKGMSMYQTAASYIMRIRLGGKSYAPDTNCPLMMHVKGLGEFTDLIQKLQTILEEDENVSSAIRRVLVNIKNVILKGKDSSLRPDSIRSVTDKLQKRALSVISLQEDAQLTSPPRAVSAGGSLVGRRTLRVLRMMLDQQSSLPQAKHSVDILSDVFTSQSTPVRIPCVLSAFTSPEVTDDDLVSKSLHERLQGKVQRKTKPLVPRFVANMDWAQPAHHIGLTKQEQPVLDYYIPSKTVVHAAPRISAFDKSLSQRILESASDQENISSHEPPCNEHTKTIQTNRKRNIDQVISSQPSKRPKNSGTRTTKRAKPLQKGQKQLTAFFRV